MEIPLPTSTVEQYIKTIYEHQREGGENSVRMKELALAMKVTPGTATAMLKSLSSQGLVNYKPRKGFHLTESGEHLALKVLRRHRLIETFLERFVGYDWSDIHEEAERLEHAVSDRFIGRIDALMGYPATDPHGDPIPTEGGTVERQRTKSLSAFAAASIVRIVRITDDGRDFLALLKSHHLMPGERIRVESLDNAAGTVTLRHMEADVQATLGIDVAAKIQAVADT